MDNTYKPAAFTIIDTITWDDDHTWRTPVLAFLESLPDDIKFLLQSLSDDTLSPTLRESLFWLIARLPHPEVVPALEQFLTVEEADVRRAAGFALAAVSSPVPFAPIAAALAQETNPSVRVALVYALYHLPHSDIIPLMTSIALDVREDLDVRGHAIEGLGEQVESWASNLAREVTRTLLVTLFDPEPEIRYWSAFALSKAGDVAVIPALQTVATEYDAPVPRWNTTVAQEVQDTIERIQNGGCAVWVDEE